MQLLTATTGAVTDFEQMQQILEIQVIQVQTELPCISFLCPPHRPPRKKKKKIQRSK